MAKKNPAPCEGGVKTEEVALAILVVIIDQVIILFR